MIPCWHTWNQTRKNWTLFLAGLFSPFHILFRWLNSKGDWLFSPPPSPLMLSCFIFCLVCLFVFYSIALFGPALPLLCRCCAGLFIISHSPCFRSLFSSAVSFLVASLNALQTAWSEDIKVLFLGCQHVTWRGRQIWRRCLFLWMIINKAH